MNLENENTIDLVEKYIAGKMDKMESLHFESQMNSNPALLEMVTQQSAIHALFIEAGLSDIRGMMINDISKQKSRTKTKWIAGGALAILISLAGLFYWTNVEKVGSAQIQKSSTTTEQNPKVENKTEPEVLAQNTTESIPKQSIVTDSKSNVIASNSRVEEPIEGNKVVEQVALPISEDQKSNGRKGTQEPPASVILPCDGFHPKYSVNVTSSFVNQETGKITISTNETNLKFNLNNSKTAVGKTFDGLPSGNYQVSIINEAGCSWKEENVIVKETNCIPLEKDIFRLSSENVFPFPFEKQNLKEISMYNKGMQLVKTWKTSDVLEWDGLQTNGQPAGTGIFKIVHTYSSGEVCQVVLTVFE